MLYATKDAGAAIGEILSSMSERVDSVEIKLTQDSMTTTVHLKESDQLKRSGKVKRAKIHDDKKSNSVKNGPQIFEYNGIKMDAKGWAKKLHMSVNGIHYRMRTHGNPYGKTKPTDTDKIIAGM